jgi:hypothetical protein
MHVPPEIWGIICLHVLNDVASFQTFMALSLVDKLISDEARAVLFAFPRLTSLKQLAALAKSSGKHRFTLKTVDLTTIGFRFNHGEYNPNNAVEFILALKTESLKRLCIDLETLSGTVITGLCPLVKQLTCIELYNGDSRMKVIESKDIATFAREINYNRLSRLTVVNALRWESLLLENMHSAPRLTVLQLNVSGVSLFTGGILPTQLTRLANFKNLQFLALSGQGQLDATILLFLLQSLPNLINLDVSHISRIDDAYIEHVFAKQWPLQCMSIVASRITDNSIPTLVRSLAATLVSLDISRTMILGTGVSKLSACTSLRCLGLWQVYTSRLPRVTKISWMSPLEWTWNEVYERHILQPVD